MRTFDNYFVFVITVLGMVLAVSCDETEQFNIDMLKLHNEHRAKHGVLPLQLHPNLIDIATKCAQNWNQGKSEIYVKNNWFYGDNKYANYYYIDARDLTKETAEYVFSSWYDEGENYDYSREPSDAVKDNVENFTQIVWKETKFLGVAKVSGSNRTMVVAAYWPAGNINGKYKRNVKEPEEKKDSNNDLQDFDKNC